MWHVLALGNDSVVSWTLESPSFHIPRSKCFKTFHTSTHEHVTPDFTRHSSSNPQLRVSSVTGVSFSDFLGFPLWAGHCCMSELSWNDPRSQGSLDGRRSYTFMLRKSPEGDEETWFDADFISWQYHEGFIDWNLIHPVKELRWFHCASCQLCATKKLRLSLQGNDSQPVRAIWIL